MSVYAITIEIVPPKSVFELCMTEECSLGEDSPRKHFIEIEITLRSTETYESPLTSVELLSHKH